jgi:hypothetical protein
LECGDLSPLWYAAPALRLSIRYSRSLHVAIFESGDKSPHSKT